MLEGRGDKRGITGVGEWGRRHGGGREEGRVIKCLPAFLKPCYLLLSVVRQRLDGGQLSLLGYMVGANGAYEPVEGKCEDDTPNTGADSDDDDSSAVYAAASTSVSVVVPWYEGHRKRMCVCACVCVC